MQTQLPCHSLQFGRMKLIYLLRIVQHSRHRKTIYSTWVLSDIYGRCCKPYHLHLSVDYEFDDCLIPDSHHGRWWQPRIRLYLRRTRCFWIRDRWHLSCRPSLCIRMLSQKRSWSYHWYVPDHGGPGCHDLLLRQLYVPSSSPLSLQSHNASMS